LAYFYLITKKAKNQGKNPQDGLGRQVLKFNPRKFTGVNCNTKLFLMFNGLNIYFSLFAAVFLFSPAGGNLVNVIFSLIKSTITASPSLISPYLVLQVALSLPALFSITVNHS